MRARKSCRHKTDFVSQVGKLSGMYAVVSQTAAVEHEWSDSDAVRWAFVWMRLRTSVGRTVAVSVTPYLACEEDC